MTAPAAPPASPRRRRWFADRPIAVKILSVIAFSASVGVLLCVVAVGRIDALDASQRDMYEGHVVAFSDLDAIQNTFEGVRQGYTGYFLGDAATRTALKAQLSEAQAGLEKQMEAYDGITEHPDRFATLREAIDGYVDVTEGEMVSALDAGDVATAGAVAAGPMVEAQNAVVEGFTGLRTVIREQADEQARLGADEASSAKTTLWAILGVSVLIGLAIVAVVVRQIVGTVKAVQKSVDALAAGDLTVTPEVDTRDELGRMALSLADAQQNLRAVLSSVVGSADAVARRPRSCRRRRRRSRRPPRRPAPSPAWWPVRRKRSPATCRPWRRAPRRWAPRSGRSPRTPPRPARWPPRPSPPHRPRRRRWPSSGSPRPRSATWSR